MSVVNLGRRLPALAIAAGLAACSGQTTGAGSFAPPAPATAQVLGRMPASSPPTATAASSLASR